jgi:hypothetical protein
MRESPDRLDEADKPARPSTDLRTRRSERVQTGRSSAADLGAGEGGAEDEGGEDQDGGALHGPGPI